MGDKFNGVDTAFVRRHYAQGPTAYDIERRPVRWPTPDDVAYCERQFDRWLSEVRAEAWDEGYMATGGRGHHEREGTNPYREEVDRG